MGHSLGLKFSKNLVEVAVVSRLAVRWLGFLKFGARIRDPFAVGIFPSLKGKMASAGNTGMLCLARNVLTENAE